MLRELAEERSRLAEVELQISELEISLVALRVKKASIQQQLDAYKYPVLSLPNEITSHIFVHFLPPYPVCSPLVGPHSPTALTHVSLATPHLWRAFSLSGTRFPSELLVPWIERTGNLPLSIRWDERMDGPASAFARWEYIRLRLTNSLLPLIDGKMPLLRHLDVATHYGISTDDQIWLDFSDTPLLRSVILDCDAIDEVTVELSKLRSLRLRHMSLYSCAKILSSIPNLVHCELDLHDGTADDEGDGIRLAHLESLRLKPALRRSTRVNFLSWFIVPNIRRLQVPEGWMGQDPLRALADFVTRSSGCKDLHCICISGQRRVSQSVYRAAFPTISKFVFYGDCESDEEGSYLESDVPSVIELM
ncbi:F-box domain-containing protein [Favolaschia claudopus]|uniref:F-box domain-containing protein n=1 Tax=Favolaschia claudopus TaxID=2862362 RepID=A0AAW0DR66_9AGAR